MVKYNLVINNYKFEFKNVYYDQESQQIKVGFFTMDKKIPIELLKDFIKRSLNQILNVNTETEKENLKESFLEYIEYYKIITNELGKKRILEKLGAYLILTDMIRGNFWINNILNTIDSSDNLEIHILKMLSNKLKKVSKELSILDDDNKVDEEIDFSILDIIYDNI
jgi:hypothetical protein